MALAIQSLRAEDAGNLPQTDAGWVIRTWQTDDGLPQNGVNAVLETRDGFLWVGTNSGLVRFDGARFRFYGLEEGLHSVRILSLAEDAPGALWIGTSGGGLSRIRDGHLVTFGAEQGFPEDADILAIAADRDGSLWVGVLDGLLHWTGSEFKSIGGAEGLPRKQVRALLEDSQGRLWASVISEGIFRGTKGQFERTGGEKPAPVGAYCLMESRDGAIWAGSGTGALWRWRDETWKRFDMKDGLPNSNLDPVAQTSDGNLWIGSSDKGLYRSNGDRFLPLDLGKTFLSRASVIFPDCEGSVWIGTVSDGLNRLSPRVLEYWGSQAGLRSSGVTSVAEDDAGVLWAGTSFDGVQRFANNRFEKVVDPAVSGNYPFVYTTASSADGSIWAAGEQALWHFIAGQPTKAFVDVPIRGEAIRALCTDGPSVWLGTYYSTLLQCDGNAVRVAAPSGSFHGGITSIVREAPDTLWIGSSGGLHRWDHGKIQTWTTRDGLLSSNITAIQRDPDGVLWLGTLGGGLARMKAGLFCNLTARQGLVDDVVWQIVADDFGCLWLRCNHGIMRLERKELDAFADGKISEVHPVVFGRNEGMLKEQCSGGHSPTAIKAKDGRLYFPTAGGIAEIDPRKLQNLTRQDPHAHSDDVLMDGGHFDVG
ncbi:MAG TPA: two-component regulator propeller domain-containing protein, partial [Chthoniobacteraceae bacterium]